MKLTNIKTIAQKNNIKLSDLAIKINVRKSVISRYLSGLCNPSYERLQKICEVLQCSASDVLGF